MEANTCLRQKGELGFHTLFWSHYVLPVERSCPINTSTLLSVPYIASVIRRCGVPRS